MGRRSFHRFFVDCVFRGDRAEVENSAALSSVKGQIEDELAWRLERFFGDSVPLTVRFFTFDTLPPAVRPPETYHIRFRDYVRHVGPNGLTMYVGFVPLIDLHGISSALGRTFLERNVRFALPPDGHVNRALRDTFASMLLKGAMNVSLFPFNHNGITLSAGMLEFDEDTAIIRKPRLLNGAQTISTFSDFIDRNAPALKTSASGADVNDLTVLCRVITSVPSDTITDITINANRQNPVQAWQLHANDDIQLALEDYFRRVRVPYERQHRAFAKISAEQWQSMDYKETRAIELVRLARTYLAADGELRKLQHISEVFENKRDYEDVFNPERLECDPRLVLLCYKAQFHLRSLAEEIRERGSNKYDFTKNTRSGVREIIWALVCQAMLNDDGIEEIAEAYGADLSRRHAYYSMIREFASKRVRFLLDALLNDKQYASKIAEDNYTFFRSTEAFSKAMQEASKRWGWRPQRLAREVARTIH